MSNIIRMLLNNTSNRIKTSLNPKNIDDYNYIYSLLHAYKGVIKFDFNTNEFVLSYSKK